MSSFLRAALVASPLVLAGCAIHPLPEDFSGVPTHTIVRQIRCETRQAVIDLALGWLTSDDNLANRRVDPRSREIGLEFRSGKRLITEFEPKLFGGRVRPLVQLFYDTGVAYNFNLQMTEVNNVNTDINLLKPFTASSFTLGIKGNADRQRKNERIFTLTDTFSSLLRLPPDYCDGRFVGASYNYVVGPNHAYPITGEIGAKRLIMDFIELTLFDNLGGTKDKPAGPPTLVDGLSFQTAIGGSLAPKIAFSPVGTGWSVTNAALNGSVSRTDLHQVTMGLAIRETGVKVLGGVRSELFTPLVSARSVTGTEAAAVEAVNQALTLKLFRPTFVLSQ